MCAWLRYTVSRGRCSLPEIRFRSRSLIRTRRSSRVLIRIGFFALGYGLLALGLSALCPHPSALLRSSFPGLLLEHFAGVTHALLLVRIGLAQAADVGGDLSH